MIANQIRALGDFKQLSILVSVAELTHKSLFNLFLALGALVVGILVNTAGVLDSFCRMEQGVLVDQQVGWQVAVMLYGWLVLPVLSCNGSLLELLLVGFHLPQGLHEGDTVREDVSGPACLDYVGQVFVKLVKVLR